MMNDDYRRVLCTKEDRGADGNRPVHALWFVEGGPWPTDKTMCGKFDDLDVTHLAKNRIVNCAECLAALKKERQRRSREGTARHHDRMREQRDQVEQATAGYERAPELGPDMAWVPTEEIDRILVSTMQMRAVSLRQEGNEDLAADLEIAAGRLAQHAQIEDADPMPAPVNQVRYIGTERRHRPRMVEPTIPDEEL